MGNNKNIDKVDRGRLWVKLHAPLQNKLAIFVGPATICLFAVLSYAASSWQLDVALFASVVLELTWIVGARFMRSQRVDTAIHLTGISTMAYSAVVAILIPQTMGGVAVLAVATLIYSSLYSKSHSITMAIVVGLYFVFSEVAFLLKPLANLEISTQGRFYLAVGFGVGIVPLITLFLLESRKTNRALFYERTKKNKLQSALIETIETARPIIDRAVADIRRVSNLFAEQAREQADAAAEISATVAEVSSIAWETATKANETRDLALTIQSRSEGSRRRLEQVERSFKEAIELVSDARRVVVELEKEITKLDGILTSNMEIGRQIRFLAINTGIQAAKAGRSYGGGFRVIASELRQMIRDTDRNLNRTQNLLGEIRKQSKDSSKKIETGSLGLERFFDELRYTALDIEKSVENMASTVMSISQIATAARQQQVGMNGVSTAMAQIDTAASDLSRSASGLIESVNRILSSQRGLGNALGDGTTEGEPAESKWSGRERVSGFLQAAKSRKDFVTQLYLPIQKMLSFVIGPALVALFAVLTVRAATWQDIVLLISSIGMNGAWICVYRCYKKGKLLLGNAVFVAATFGFTTLAGVLIPAVIPMVMIANVGVMAYGVFFASRYAVVGAVCASSSYIFCELFLALQFVVPRPMTGLEQFVVQFSLACILVPILALFFRRSQSINDELFEIQAEQVHEQGRVIKTIKEIYPIIGQAIAQIENTAEQFNRQASEQAASAAEIYTTVSQVSATASESARSAADTMRTTQKTEEGSTNSCHRLVSIQREFQIVNRLIEEAGDEARTLGRHVDQIEEILGFIAEINQQVKILAVNAGIEAAKAGRFAGGFRVVASKLREMIQRTDGNLQGVRALLEVIRLKAWEGVSGIERGKRRLKDGFRHLQKVSADLEWSTTRFRATVEQVAQIAHAAREQQLGMEGVGVAMDEIDRAAAQLSESGLILKESMAQIEDTQESFQAVLQADVSL